jgi:putative membrane-bound dehydrogenase-like protein
MKRSNKLLLSLGAPLLLLFCWHAAWGVEPKKQSKPSPRVSAAPSTNAPASFQVKRGFRLELVAAEPMVAAPAALAFDERGRLFVAEMRDYPDRRERSPHLGQVRMLEDMDENGVFQTSTVYADNLPWPSAVACYAGGIFVAATPQVFYLKDSEDNGIADIVKVVFSGFGARPYSPNPKALLNNFNWGLDNRLHCGMAGLDGVVSVLSAAQIPSVELSGSDFAFDPRTLALVPEAGPGQTGMSFDNRGRKFSCDSNRPLRLAMCEPRYLARNPFFPPPPLLLDAASPATVIYRFPEARLASEPAEGRNGAFTRQPRALPAARPASEPAEGDLLPGEGRPASTNALAAAWLTDARGCVVYRGNTFPSNYLDNVFVADPEAHLIHRFVLRENGLEVAAERAGDEQRTEFLVSRDTSFRPVQIVNGPDGALYVADFQTGHESGRIYRIVPESFKRPVSPRLDQLNTHDLVVLLAQANGWQADTAARLLYERQDPAAVALLTNMLEHSRLPLARLRALHALEGLGALRAAQVLGALKDGDARVREHAVLLAERFAASPDASEELWEQLRAMAADSSARVRLQLAFTLGELPPADRNLLLANLLAQEPDNPWMSGAVLSSLRDGAGQFLTALAGVAPFGNTPAGQQFLAQLAAMIGVRGKLEDVTQALDLLDRVPVSANLPYGMLLALGEGLHRSGSSLRLVDKQNRLQRFFDTALISAINENIPWALRADAVHLLGISPLDYPHSADWLRALLVPTGPYVLESAVVAARGRCVDALVAPDLIRFGAATGPALRNEAMMALLARAERARPLLAAIEAGNINAATLPSTCLNLLRTHEDPVVSELAVRLFGPVTQSRPNLVEQFEPALRLKGEVGHGHALFLARCAGCHRLGGEGRVFGPDLAGAKVRGKEAILRAILEPNREVQADYTTCVARSNEGQSLVGIKASQSASTLTLRQLDGTLAVWLLEDLQSIQTQSWSLMPEGLEQGLSLEDMADLLHYVLTAAP